MLFSWEKKGKRRRRRRGW